MIRCRFDGLNARTILIHFLPNSVLHSNVEKVRILRGPETWRSETFRRRVKGSMLTSDAIRLAWKRWRFSWRPPTELPVAVFYLFGSATKLCGSTATDAVGCELW